MSVQILVELSVSSSLTYKCTLLKKESCRVSVLSHLAVTGKGCTCPIMKAALAEVD